MEKSKKGHTIRSQAREVIANVIKICDEEAQNNCYKLPVSQRNERASLYTGCSVSTITRIRAEDRKRMGEGSSHLASPGKKRSRPTVTEKVSSFDFGVIRRTIEKFYIQDKIVPTTKKLLLRLREEINFTYSRETLRKLLKANGFYWRKCQNKRKLLMEKPNILHLRFKYLRSIKQYREQNRPIIFIDETWVDTDLTFSKCWQSAEVFGVVKGGGSTGILSKTPKYTGIYNCNYFHIASKPNCFRIYLALGAFLF